MHQNEIYKCANLVVIQGQAELFGEETAFLHLLVEAIFAVRKQVQKNRKKDGISGKVGKMKETYLQEECEKAQSRLLKYLPT